MKKESAKVVKKRWSKKKDRLGVLDENIQRLKYNVSLGLKSDNEKIFLTSLVVALMIKTSERVGNEESASNSHVGIIGLQKKQVNVISDKVILEYVGKSGVEHSKYFSDKRIAKALKLAKKRSPSKFIFTTTEGFKIKSDRVNRYLSDFGITAKDIRGYSANNWLIKKLVTLDIEDTKSKRLRQFNKAVRSVAEKVGHGFGTIKKHYLVPELGATFVEKGVIIELDDIPNYKEGGELDAKKKKEIYQKWSSLVNMSASELKKFSDTKEGKEAGLSVEEAKELGISYGRESARWIGKMKKTPYEKWDKEMWDWANKQISFISRMRGNKGGLYNDKGEKTRKHTSLLIWGHNPEKKRDGGELEKNKIHIKLDMDDEGYPYVEYESQTMSIGDFIEDILNEKFGLDIEYTWDDGHYNSWVSGYDKEIDKLENEFGKLDWEDVGDVYFSYATEAMQWFKKKFDDIDGVDISVEYDELTGSSTYSALEALEERLKNRKYWNDFRETKDQIEERLTGLGYDYDEFYRLLRKNFDTNGKASRRLLGEDGLLSEWLEEDFVLEDEEDEDYVYSSDIWNKIENIIHAMGVAERRHEETDYDSIDKRGMTEDEVRALRKSKNLKKGGWLDYNVINKDSKPDKEFFDHLYKEHHDTWDVIQDIQDNVNEENAHKYKLKILTIWEKELLPHFNEEEEKLFVLFRDKGLNKEVDELISEHNEIKTMIRVIGKYEKGLGKKVSYFCEMLKNHIKKEEGIMGKFYEDPYGCDCDKSFELEEVEYEFNEGGEIKAKKIITEKIGLNESNANYLLETSRKFAIWLADSIVKNRIQQKQDTEPNKEQRVIRKEVLEEINKSDNFIQRYYANQIRVILDWIMHPLTESQNLRQLTFSDALEKAQIFHEELVVMGGDVDYKEPKENIIITTYAPDENNVTYYWVVIPKNFCGVESSRMGHCGRTGYGNILLSLRSIKPYGKEHTISDSHVTITFGSDGVFYQVKGKKNQKPSPKYFPMIYDLIIILLDGKFFEERINQLEKEKEGIIELLKTDTEHKLSTSEIRDFSSQLKSLDDELNFLKGITFSGFGQEHQSSEDYGFGDMSDSEFEHVVSLKPEVLSDLKLDEFSKEKLRIAFEVNPSMFNGLYGQLVLYKNDIIEKCPETTFTYKAAPNYIDRIVHISNRHRDDLIEMILGDLHDLYEGYWRSDDEVLDWLDYLNEENEAVVIDKICKITGLGKSLVSEKGIHYFLSEGYMEDMDEEYDFSDIFHALNSALVNCEESDYYDYTYKELKDVLSEYGDVVSLNDEGVSLNIDLLDKLSYDEIGELIMDIGRDDLETIFGEAIARNYIEVPTLYLDERFTPHPSKECFNEVFDIYRQGGTLKKTKKTKQAKTPIKVKSGLLKDKKQIGALRDMGLESASEYISIYHEAKGNFIIPKNKFYIWFYDIKDAGSKIESGEFDFLMFPLSRNRLDQNVVEDIWKPSYQKQKGATNLMGMVQGWYDEENKKIYVHYMSVRPKARRNKINTHLIKFAKNYFKTNDVEFVDLTKEGKAFVEGKTFAGGGVMQKTLLATNGKPSNLTPEQYKLVRTPEFKAWFGDWENNPKNASKVVDENGEPLVVWHGGSFNGQGEFRGFGWFTSNKADAKYYAKTNFGSLTQCFAVINNPFYSGETKDGYIETNNAVTLAFKSGRYDGVIDVHNNKILDVVIFKSTQIKLADGTNTTFDGNNPDIRFDEGGEVEDLISKGIVELKMFDTKPEHAKEYGLDAKTPLYIQNLCVSENERLKGVGKKVLQYIDDYAIKNGHDVIFGHIAQKAEFNKDGETNLCDIDLIKSLLRKNGYDTRESNNDFHKFVRHGNISIPPHRTGEVSYVAGNRFEVEKIYRGIQSGEIPFQVKEVETYNPKDKGIAVFDDVIKENQAEINPNDINGLWLAFSYNGENQIFPIDGNHRMFKMHSSGVPKTKVIIVDDVEAIKKHYNDGFLDKNKIKKFQE